MANAMAVDVTRLFEKPCGWCPDNSGESTYSYCKVCGGTTEMCATCTCKEPQSEPRKMPCRVCGGKGKTKTGLGLYREVEEQFTAPILRCKAEGLTPEEGRKRAINGPLTAWYSPATDGWEKILQVLLEGHTVILDIEGKLIPMRLEHWRGCFD